MGNMELKNVQQGVTKPLQVEVSIAAAAVATLRATPVELVPAPGAGYTIKLLHAHLMLDYTAPAFTETADNLVIRHNNGTGLIASETIEMTGFIDQTGDMVTNARPKVDLIGTKAQVENTSLVLHNSGDGEFAGSGGSALRVKVDYEIWPTGF